MATNSMAHPEGTGSSTLGHAAGAVLGAARGVWLVGLGLVTVGVGLVTVGVSQSGRLVGSLARRGKDVEPVVFEQGRRATAGIGGMAGAIGGRLKGLVSRRGQEPVADERIAGALETLGVPTRHEVDNLSAKVDELSARLEHIRGGRS